MTHCMIWIGTNGDHIEANLEAIPREGETFLIEDEREEPVKYVVDSVTHSLMSQGNKWKQIIDISLKTKDSN